MNLPNRLTLLRVLLIPVFIALVMVDSPLAQALAALAFVVASLTDWMDGWYARKHSQETDFGKLMDPMADKLLVMSALVASPSRPDELAERLNEDVLTLLHTLTDYELRGIVVKLPDGRYSPTREYFKGEN